MVRKNDRTRWVIFVGPQQPGGLGNRYIAQDGSITDIKSRAARFHAYVEVKEFADEQRVELTPRTYIDQEAFTESELQSGL
jgi:hypothetical protein